MEKQKKIYDDNKLRHPNGQPKKQPKVSQKEEERLKEQQEKKKFTGLNLFVGQIPFTATKSDIEKHFVSYY